MITLYFAPKSRAFGAAWLLEEIGVPYALKRLNLEKGEQKSAELLALNPLGKVPTLKDGDVVVSERAAIAAYLADRYALGRLAPRLDDPLRGEYLRWMFYSVGVMEPYFLAKFKQIDMPASQAPYGTFAETDKLLNGHLAERAFFLGSNFSAADVMMGTMLRWGLMWKLFEGKTLSDYVARLEAREAFKRALAIENAVA